MFPPPHKWFMAKAAGLAIGISENLAVDTDL